MFIPSETKTVREHLVLLTPVVQSGGHILVMLYQEAFVWNPKHCGRMMSDASIRIIFIEEIVFARVSLRAFPSSKLKSNLSLYQKGVYFTGIKVFNNLPQNIKNLSNNTKQFKSALKNYLHAHSFYSTL
jgi:hypothetical protein